MRRPRHVLLAAVVTLGLLTWIAPEAARIEPVQAGAHEGQDVRIAGVVTQLRSWGDGGRFVLAHAGHGVEAVHQGPLPSPGAWIEASGDLRRSDGALVLWADTWEVATPPEPPRIPLATLAQDPEAWRMDRIEVVGTIDGEQIMDGRHRLPWIGNLDVQGAVLAIGTLDYDARCLCHVLTVEAARPWTP